MGELSGAAGAYALRSLHDLLIEHGTAHRDKQPPIRSYHEALLLMESLPRCAQTSKNTWAHYVPYTTAQLLCTMSEEQKNVVVDSILSVKDEVTTTIVVARAKDHLTDEDLHSYYARALQYGPEGADRAVDSMLNALRSVSSSRYEHWHRALCSDYPPTAVSCCALARVSRQTTFPQSYYDLTRNLLHLWGQAHVRHPPRPFSQRESFNEMFHAIEFFDLLYPPLDTDT